MQKRRESSVRLVSGFVIRKILDETVAIPSQEAARHLSGLASLNETGEFLFSLLQNEQTEQSLINALIKNYDVDTITATADVKAFLKILQENNLLENSAL